MQVKLVAVTQPLIQTSEGQNLSPEGFIVYAARVSNPANQLNTASAPKLLAYLIKHRHWSPFEMVDLCFEISTTRGIAAQILRHRSFSFQEFSQRYAHVASPPELAEARSQHPKNRQLSEDTLPEETKEWWASEQTRIYGACRDLYEEAIKKGIAKECARFALPLATSTTLYMKGSLRSVIHYVGVRATEDTQKEHRDIAREMMRLTAEVFPSVGAALEWS